MLKKKQALKDARAGERAGDCRGDAELDEERDQNQFVCNEHEFVGHESRPAAFTSNIQRTRCVSCGELAARRFRIK